MESVPFFGVATAPVSRLGLNFDAYECLSGTYSLAQYVGDEFDGLSVVAQRQVGKGRVILLGSVICHDDLLKLVNVAKIADASENVVLTERDNGVIVVVETENRQGYVNLDGEYTNIIDGHKYSGKVEIKPYQVMVLVK